MVLDIELDPDVDVDGVTGEDVGDSDEGTGVGGSEAGAGDEHRELDGKAMVRASAMSINRSTNFLPLEVSPTKLREG